MKYICPESMDNCHCIFPGKRPEMKAIIAEKRFNELMNFERCGFDGNLELYCCPSKTVQRIAVDSEDSVAGTEGNQE